MKEGMNAREIRNRCLAAMVEAEDVETKRELWQAAVFYNRESKEIGGAGAAVTLAGQPLTRDDEGSSGAREMGW